MKLDHVQHGAPLRELCRGGCIQRQALPVGSRPHHIFISMNLHKVKNSFNFVSVPNSLLQVFKILKTLIKNLIFSAVVSLPVN